MTTRDESSRLPTRIVLILALCGGFGPFAVDAYMPGMVDIANEFGVQASTAQLTLTGFLLALGLGQLVLGPLSDQVGRRRIMLIGLTGATLASILCAVAPTIWILITARILQGAFGAAGVVLSKAIVADLATGADMAKAFSLLMSVQSLAPIIAPIVGGILVPGFGWRSVFWFLSVLGLIMLTCVAVFVGESLPPQDRHTGGARRALGDMGALLRSPEYVAAVVMFTVSFGVLFSYISASPFILQRMLGFSQVEYSVVFTINSLAIFASNLVNARLVGRYAPLHVATRAALMLMLGVVWMLVAVLVLDLATWAVLVGFFSLTACVGLLFPNISALAVRAAGARRGAGSAVLGAAQMTMAAGVAPLAGLGDGRSALPMVALMAVFAMCMAVALPVLRRRSVG